MVPPISTTESTFDRVPYSLIQFNLAGLDDSPTECDGCSRLVSHNLTLLGINHEIRVGSVAITFFDTSDIVRPHIVCPHFWVHLVRDVEKGFSSDAYLIDFRLKMWLGHLSEESLKALPHGFVRQLDYSPNVLYKKENVVAGGVLPKGLYNILRQRFPIDEGIQNFLSSKIS